MRLLEVEKCVDRLLGVYAESRLKNEDQEIYENWSKEEQDMLHFCMRLEAVESITENGIYLDSSKVVKSIKETWGKTLKTKIEFKRSSGGNYVDLSFTIDQFTPGGEQQQSGDYGDVKAKIEDLYSSDIGKSKWDGYPTFTIWNRLWRNFNDLR